MSVTLGERIDPLEGRLMFPEEAIETLNAPLPRQWQQFDALTRQVAILG